MTSTAKKQATVYSNSGGQTISELTPSVDTCTTFPKEKCAGKNRAWRRTHREQVIARYHGPMLFVNKAWELNVTRSMSGWTCNFRIYNIVSNECAASAAVGSGDIKALQDLFDKGLASPFDIVEIGKGESSWRTSLLGVSCLEGRLLHFFHLKCPMSLYLP